MRKIGIAGLGFVSIKAKNKVVRKDLAETTAKLENIGIDSLMYFSEIGKVMLEMPEERHKTMFVLAEELRDDQVLCTTESAYDELQINLRKRLIFEFHSFFWQKNYPFSAEPQNTRFSFNVKMSSEKGDYRAHWLSILLNVNTDSGYLIEIATATKSKTFTDVEECLKLLSLILEQNLS